MHDKESQARELEALGLPLIAKAVREGRAFFRNRDDLTVVGEALAHVLRGQVADRVWAADEPLRYAIEGASEAYGSVLVGDPYDDNPRDVRQELREAWEAYNARLDEAEALLS